MAKQIENSKGFLVIRMTEEEAKRIGFGIPDKGCLCALDNNVIKGEIYYIAAINDCLCKEHYEEFVETSRHYQEDSEIEERNFNFVMDLIESSITIEPQYPQIIEL